MTMEFLVLSAMAGLLYGWASAHWSNVRHTKKPKLLQTRVTNLFISLLALGTIAYTGIATDSLFNSILSLFVILVVSLLTNLYINSTLGAAPDSANQVASPQQAASLIIELSDIAAVQTRNLLSASNDRLNPITASYHYFCLVISYKKLVESGMAPEDALATVDSLAKEIAAAISNETHRAQLMAHYRNTFREMASEYGRLPIKSVAHYNNTVYSEFADLIVGASRIGPVDTSMKEGVYKVMNNIITSLNID